ncbi:MAG: hypothetical protein CMA30_02265 [Euryarchaeota archaeon]|nr:hypothetical protein [Euryarchaeota archaeon]
MENKSYVTLHKGLIPNTVQQDLPRAFNLYDVINDKWITVPIQDIKRIHWESLQHSPEDIFNIDDNDEKVLSELKSFISIIKKMVDDEIVDELKEYADMTPDDLKMLLLLETGYRCTHETEVEVQDYVWQLCTLHITHNISSEKLLVRILDLEDKFNVTRQLNPKTINLIPESEIYGHLNEMTDIVDVSAAWNIWKEILQWHIDQNIKDLNTELIDTTDPEEVEEIETAIELVNGAIDDVDVNQFKSVGDIAHFWPALLYPPPHFVG